MSAEIKTEKEEINGVENEAHGSSDNRMDTDEPTRFLDHENFSQFFDVFTGKVKETVGSSTKIPIKPDEYDYYLTNKSFKTFVQTQNDRVLKMISSLLKQQNIKRTNINSNKLDDDERMELLIDSNDQIIEKLGIKLDELQGLRKKTEVEAKLSSSTLQLTSRNINTSWNKDIGMVPNKTLLNQFEISNNTRISAADPGKKIVIHKPQKLFNDKIDNSFEIPFVPKIRSKPNALRPLSDIYIKLDQIKVNKEVFEENSELLENPYTYEIEQLELNLDNETIKEELVEPRKLDDTPYKYIETTEDLIWLCDHLGKNNRSKIKEIAVDLEHHSYRSFLGFTCLMQISTREQDFIVDTIKLRSEIYRLNEIFTDWTLVKVLHGADFDVEWLQKDFGIYVVNMFDTGQASRALQYPHFSLSYLLQKFCNVTAQKQYQQADWRLRPLSEAMIKYAKEDTHYLLYIYDHLKNELIKQSLLAQVHDKSKLICKKVYKKPLFFSKGYLNLCQHNSHLNAKQMKALHDLYKWRDRMARESDESTEYVLKNHQLLKIAELLPREIYGILALCNPISTLVESNVHEMLELVKNAREFKGTFEISYSNTDVNSVFKVEEKVAEKPSTSVLESLVHTIKYDPNNILNCPHDFADLLTQTEAMEITSESFDGEHRSNLNDLLIKPGKNVLSDLPNEFVKISSSNLSESFSKNYQKFVVKNKNFQPNRYQKLVEKITSIKETIKNPFEMYLPINMRSNENIDFSDLRWNLIKPSESFASKSVELNASQEEIAVETKHIEMIPLKQQFKNEKYSINKKLNKKVLKNVDLSEAIIEYNKTKQDKIDALGNEEQNVQFNQLESKIKEGLNSISNTVKSMKTPISSQDSDQPFSYENQDINKLFTKQVAKDSDHSAKVKRVNNGKVNKRRITNAITRSKNTQSMTFKKTD